MPMNCASASVVALVLIQRVLFLDDVAQLDQHLDVLDVVNGGNAICTIAP